MADIPHWKTQPRKGGKFAPKSAIASSVGTPESLSPLTTPSSMLSSLPSRPFDSPQSARRNADRDDESDSMPGSMPDAPMFGDRSSQAGQPRDFLVYPKVDSEPDSDSESVQDVKPAPSNVKSERPDVKPPHVDLTYIGPAKQPPPLRPASPNRLRLHRVPSLNSLNKPKQNPLVSFNSTFATSLPLLSVSAPAAAPTSAFTSATKPSPQPLFAPPTATKTQKKKAPMSNQPIQRFRSDGKDGEDAQDFLRYFHREMRIGDVTDEKEKMRCMRDYIASGSRANRWYKGLTTADTASWQTFEAAFTAEWPEIEESLRTPQEVQRELLDTRLRESELGEKTNVAGKELWTHVAWAEKVLALAKEAGMAASATYVWNVREYLPDILKDKVPSNCADWTAFTTAVKAVDIDYIRDKVAKLRRENALLEDLNRRMAALEVRRPAVASGRSAPVGGGNVVSPTTSYSKPAAPTAGARPQFTPRPPATLEQRAALQSRLQSMPHHPNTEAGRQAYRAQVDQWFQKYGAGTRVSEETPFPLRPGSEPICSGECFKCGKMGHIKPNCQAPREILLHPKETAWRQICSGVLRGGSRPADAAVNFVAEVYGDESLWAQSEDSSLTEDQGKGVGSSV